MKILFILCCLELIVIASAYLINSNLVVGSCGATNLCCQGRDSGCVIQKDTLSSVVKTSRDKPCYCDHACLKLGDCCYDFKETCGVIDCTVSEWNVWSSCSNGCGAGNQHRNRTVKTYGANGGKHCPRLEQVRNCRSYGDCDQHPRYYDKSVALLSMFPIDEERVNTDDNRVREESSCVAFIVLRASRVCRKIMESLTEGSRICLHRGSGDSFDGLTSIGRWMLAIPGTDNTTNTNGNTCHGKWIGDTTLNVNCDHSRCALISHLLELSRLFRVRRGIEILANETSKTKGGRVVRRRRERLRRKGRRRRRREITNI